jgi:ATP-binding cassette subfamily G (WHITE) protein 2 (PDR)
VYFGPVGENSRMLLDYFENKGGRKCDDNENPAEYMLEVVNKGQNDRGKDWHSVWNGSNERQTVLQELDQIHKAKRDEPTAGDDDANAHAEFAMPFGTQLTAVTVRVFQQYWRMPSYIASKWALAISAGLFIGFTFFQSGGSLAGMQNVIFSVFMLTTIFSTLVQQVSEA